MLPQLGAADIVNSHQTGSCHRSCIGGWVGRERGYECVPEIFCRFSLRATPGTSDSFESLLRSKCALEDGVSRFISVTYGLLLTFVSFRLTVIPGPRLFPLTVQLLDPFPCRVEFIKDIQ